MFSIHALMEKPDFLGQIPNLRKAFLGTARHITAVICCRVGSENTYMLSIKGRHSSNPNGSFTQLASYTYKYMIEMTISLCLAL